MLLPIEIQSAFTRKTGMYWPLSILWLGLLSLAAIVTPVPVKADELSWDSLAEGIAVTVWTPEFPCRGEIPPLVLVKVDPEQNQFAIYNFRDEELPAPLAIHDWQRRIGARILFNAGLFLEDYSYLGLLYKEGRSIGSKVHPYWKGLFVAEPLRPLASKARVLDLAQESFPTDPPTYLVVAQSLMLLDASGKPRVRKSGKRAHQTVVGEDIDGKILLMKTTEPVALWDLAVCLRERLPRLRHAMAMDGGSSSDLLIASEVLKQTKQGNSPPSWQTLVDGQGPTHIPLPTVIAVTLRNTSRRPAIR